MLILNVMKKRIYLLATTFFIGSALLAQPTLLFETHRLKAGIDNSMSHCAYMEPGNGGENVVWDFSGLEFEKVFTGYVENSASTEYGKNFEEADTELREFNSQFYFSIGDNKIEQLGYSSSNGKIQTRYTLPFVKMKFPFTYNDVFSGSFSGATYYSGIEMGVINGNYTIEADGWGQLVLPGEITYNNTLRVKTEKSYVNELESTDQYVSITSYRWYNSMHRYPLLVLTEFSVGGSDNTSLNYQAAYNTNAVDGISPIAAESIILYPNPTIGNLMLEYDAVAAGKLVLSIIDNNGRVLREFEQEIAYSGIQHISLSSKINGLVPANYQLVIRNGDMSIKRSFSIVE